MIITEFDCTQELIDEIGELRAISGHVLGAAGDDWDSKIVDCCTPIEDNIGNSRQKQQVIPQTTAISNIKLPILKKEEYDIWAMEMEHYLEYIDNDVWKERKAKNILLMTIPKEHMRRFHGMDDAKEIWEAIRTRFGGNANSKKMQKAVFKQQFEAFTISSSEGLEKGYDRFQQFLLTWSNLAMNMRTKPDVDTLSIDDLYNNLRVFEQEIQGASKTSSSAQNVAFVSQSKSNTNKVKSGFTGAYSTCTPSTSSTNIPEKEVLAGFADEVIYSLFAKQSEDWGGGVIAMIAIRMKKFYKKTGRRVRVDGKTHVGFDKKKLECFNCHNTGHFARECTTKGTHDGKKRRDSFYQHREAVKQEKNQMGLLTMDDGIVNWGEHTEDEETNHALMAISSSSEAMKLYEKDEKLKKYRRIGIKAVKEKEQLQKTLDSWKDSSTNLWRLINSDMSSNKEDSVGKPLYSRFIKTNDHKGVPHPLSGDYTPTPQEEIDESLYVYGKKGPQPAEPQLQLNGGRPNANSVRPNVNTGRVNVNSVRSNVNTGRTNVNPVRPTVNTGSSNVNTVRSRQPVPTKTSNSFSPKRPQVTRINWRILKNSMGDLLPLEHKVLFTETECLVVSSDFKMPDENQILLKVPRHHNMYSFDMKTPTPAKGFACLIAKATSDESKLWHRRLGHINFKNLNKLVKGNLVRGLPSKVFRHSYSMLLRIRDEDVELIVVPSTVKNTEEKAESRKSSTNSKKEGYY
ncbi:ribonuclease H-like domain-containing protein [Tanacetum coccineum]